MSAALIDPAAPDAPGAPRARMMLDRARWAATAFATFDRDRTHRVVEAVADVAYQNAERFAIATVEETGMGVVEHKRHKNEACSRGIVERYAVGDYVDAQIDTDAKIVAVPKPAGVVLALTPSTNPIATVYFKVLLALMTRNAVVVSPHPLARKVSVDAVRALAEAAVSAGAPDGCLQVVEESTIPLIEALMADRGVDVIVATGGTAVVRAAYRSGNPSLGVGPGNVPALVLAPRHCPRRADHLAQRPRHAVREQLHHAERERRSRDSRQERGEAGALAEQHHDHRHRHRGDDDDTELELDRGEEVERSHRPFVSSA